MIKKNKSKYYADIGLKALREVSNEVHRKAYETKTPIPFWDGERVLYKIPNEPVISE